METLLAEITWRPRIGDPDPLGWTVTIAYLVACGCCVMAARKEQARQVRGDLTGLPWFWYVLAAMMFGLGLNKQLDLQVLLTQIGREMARSKSLLAYRRTMQAVFVFVAGVIGAAGLAAGFYAIRGRWKKYGLALVGLLLLVGFVFFRTASLYHVAKPLQRAPELTHWINATLELGGAILVIIGALKDSVRKG